MYILYPRNEFRLCLGDTAFWGIKVEMPGLYFQFIAHAQGYLASSAVWGVYFLQTRMFFCINTVQRAQSENEQRRITTF